MLGINSITLNTFESGTCLNTTYATMICSGMPINKLVANCIAEFFISSDNSPVTKNSLNARLNVSNEKR